MIHDEHPFLPPASERDPVRRFRGRLASPVTLWTAAMPEEPDPAGAAGTDMRPAGLPVSSLLVATGERGSLLGLVDPDSEFWSVAAKTERFAVAVLRWDQRDLADAFAGVTPAPGGPFRLSTWRDTSWGPVPESAETWAGCAVTGTRTVGWSLLVEAELVHIELGADAGSALVHRRGRYTSTDRDPHGAGS